MKKLTLASILLFTLTLIGCNKEAESPSKNVLIVGYMRIDNDDAQAAIWENNTGTLLERGLVPSDGIDYSTAASVAIAGRDVIVVGEERIRSGIGGIYVAKYWENGVGKYLTDNTDWSYANSACSFEGDVYIAGSEDTREGLFPKYWKNGELVSLPTESNIAEARSIAVAQSGIYVAGIDMDPASGTFYAKYWKDGVGFSLSREYSEANSISIDGNDVYVAGAVGFQAVYWKNGTLIQLPAIDEGAYSTALSVYAKDGEVYVAGYSYHEAPYGQRLSKAAYWKNNNMYNLTAAFYSSRANSIYPDGNDIYIAGMDSSTACYWKNDVKIELAPGEARSIIVY